MYNNIVLMKTFAVETSTMYNNIVLTKTFAVETSTFLSVFHCYVIAQTFAQSYISVMYSDLESVSLGL